MKTKLMLITRKKQKKKTRQIPCIVIHSHVQYKPTKLVDCKLKNRRDTYDPDDDDGVGVREVVVGLVF